MPTQEEIEKQAAQIQEVRFNEVYLPNFVKLAQHKLAAAGLPQLQNWDEVEQALDIVASLDARKTAQSGNLLKQAADELRGQATQVAKGSHLDELVKASAVNAQFQSALVAGLQLQEAQAA